MRVAGVTGSSGRARPAAEVEGWCASFEKRCRASGVRVTPQRLAVYRVLAEQTSHPTAERVSAAVRERMRSLSPATVYRILDSLREAGLIRRVSTYAGVARYDANLAPHHHLVCRLCGEMTDLPAPALEAPRVEELHVPGFVVEELELRVLGRCRRCRPRSQST